MSVFRGLASAWTRLGPGLALRRAALETIRRLALPQATLTFAYLGEDLILSRRLESHLRTGFYVDVGCNDPLRLSNTFLLYAQGWRGLNIDANPAVVARNRRLRPRDASIEALVGAGTEDRLFHTFADDAVSSADPEFVEIWSRSSTVVERRRLRPRPLTEILDQHQPLPSIDLLNVDVEGMDLEVLESLDFARYRPRVVAVEMHGFDLERGEENGTFRQLTRSGYRCFAYNGLTGFFELAP